MFVVTGFSVFAIEKPGDFEKHAKFEGEVDGVNYTCDFKLVRINNINDLKGNDVGKKDMALRFFNVLIKFFLR